MPITVAKVDAAQVDAVATKNNIAGWRNPSSATLGAKPAQAKPHKAAEAIQNTPDG